MQTWEIDFMSIALWRNENQIKTMRKRVQYPRTTRFARVANYFKFTLTLLWMNRSPKRTDWERTVYGKKRSICAWWACDNMNGTFVESSKYIMLSYSGLCQRRRIHCNQKTSYCSLFFLILWTSIYHYLVQKLIQMLNVVWQKNRDMIVARMSISVLPQGIILRFINISLCYHKLELILEFYQWKAPKPNTL